MKSLVEMLQPAAKMTPEMLAAFDREDSHRRMYGRLLDTKPNWLMRRVKAWRMERERRGELEAELAYALIDPTLIERAGRDA